MSTTNITLEDLMAALLPKVYLIQYYTNTTKI